jgi:hypothetical protein
MGSTAVGGGEPSPLRCGPVASSRKLGGERKGAPAPQPDVRPMVSPRQRPQPETAPS